MIKTFIDPPFKHLLLPIQTFPHPTARSGSRWYPNSFTLNDRSAKINPMKMKSGTVVKS
jgi:hypothetical protein